ncbi:MAG: hypothetical protein KKB59_19065 [Spirochaetes bacterium]|nr:hypothetical protein [Spirochaetota bacterium]
MVKKSIKCAFCSNTSKTHKLDRLFLDFSTSNNSPDNMLPACNNCIRAFKLRYLSNGVLVLRKMGFIPDKRAEWRLDKSLIRSEMCNEKELLARIAQLEGEVHDLEHYIKLLERKGYEPYDPIEGLR